MQLFTRSKLFLAQLAKTAGKAQIESKAQFASGPFLSAQSRSIVTLADHNLIMEPTTDRSSSVYVQRSKGNDMMTISFEHSINGKKKSFNLYRKVDEPLQAALERLKLNLMKLTKVKKSKSEPEDENLGTYPSLSLSINGTVLDPTSTKNADAWIEGAVMKINDKPFVIKLNEPQVVIMKLPSTIMKGFITVPFVDVANCDIHTCKFFWYRQISASEKDEILSANPSARVDLDYQTYWLYLSEGITYSPTDDDVAHNLKVVCQPSDGIKIGVAYSCFSGRLVEIGPPLCPFEKRHAFTTDKLHGNQLRFVSYNILADLYADSDYSRKVLFAHCPPHALDIDYRRQLLLKEIHYYNADIVCLQEVDRIEFNKTYEPYFKLVSGHRGVFDTKGGQVGEGAATFFRDDRFELIDTHKTILSRLIDPSSVLESHVALGEDLNVQAGNGNSSGDLGEAIKSSSSTLHPILDDLDSAEARDLLSRMDPIRDAIQKNEALRKRFMDRHTIVQTNLLKFKGSENKYVIVANTHLYFAPDADHIRLLQGGVIVKYLEYLKEYYQASIRARLGQEELDMSIIFCGDMNSSPDCGLFKLLHEGMIDESLPDWTSNKVEVVKGLSLQTSLRLSSAYRDIPYTNYTPGFNGCLDYIYHDAEKFDCKSVVPLPDHEDVIATGGLPSDVFPSDHIALIANLQINE